MSLSLNFEVKSDSLVPTDTFQTKKKDLNNLFSNSWEKINTFLIFMSKDNFNTNIMFSKVT